MKGLFILILIFCTGIYSYAQNGFYFQPQLGFGISKITGLEDQKNSCNCGLYIGGQKSVLSFNVGAKLGYQFERLRFGMGLQLLRTAAVRDPKFGYFPSGVEYAQQATDMYDHYDHLLVPVSIGYKIPLNKKWSIVPEAGTHFLLLKENDRSYSNSNCFFFSGKLNFEKEIKTDLSLVIAPAYYVVIAPVYYQESGLGIGFTPNHVNAFNSVFMMEGGLLWHFAHKGNANTKKKTKSGK